MTIDEFEVLARTYGADIRRWPEHVRTAAEALTSRSEAVGILADAQWIDRLILRSRPDVSGRRADEAIDRVMTCIDAAATPARPRHIVSPPSWSFPMASFACAAAVGVFLGIVKPLPLFRGPADGGAIVTILDSIPTDSDWILR